MMRREQRIQPRDQQGEKPGDRPHFSLVQRQKAGMAGVWCDSTQHAFTRLRILVFPLYRKGGKSVETIFPMKWKFAFATIPDMQ